MSNIAEDQTPDITVTGITRAFGRAARVAGKVVVVTAVVAGVALGTAITGGVPLIGLGFALAAGALSKGQKGSAPAPQVPAATLRR